jgi:hypothetical protein
VRLEAVIRRLISWWGSDKEPRGDFSKYEKGIQYEDTNLNLIRALSLSHFLSINN